MKQKSEGWGLFPSPLEFLSDDGLPAATATTAACAATATMEAAAAAGEAGVGLSATGERAGLRGCEVGVGLAATGKERVCGAA